MYRIDRRLGLAAWATIGLVLIACGDGPDEAADPKVPWKREGASVDPRIECGAASMGDDVLMQESSEQEEERVFRKLSRLAATHCAEAIYQLVPFYMGGHASAPIDDAKAVAAARKSAQLGYSKAQLQMGKFYLWGFDGLSKDGGEAVTWFQHAAVQRNVTAMWNLTAIYEEGKLGVEVNAERAAYWREQSNRACARACDESG